LRIPFRFKEGAPEAAYVYAVLDSKPLHIYASIEFMLDTGAVKTIVSDRDANKLGVDYKMLEKLDCGMLGIGGTVDTYVLKDAKLIFNSADNKAHTEQLDSLCFLKHSEMNEKIVRIPSVLGRDILNKYLLKYDKRQGKVYLTDERL